MAKKDQILFCDGNVQIGERTKTTLATKMIGPLFANKFSLKMSVEEIEIPLKQLGKSGKNADIIKRAMPTELTLGLNKMSVDLLAVMFAGQLSALSTAGGSATSESFTLYTDAWTPIRDTSGKPRRNVTDFTHATHVEGTDYEVNRRLGLIKAIEGGGITDASVVAGFGYAWGAITGNKIAAGTKVSHPYEIVLDGQYIGDRSSPVYARIPYVELSVSQDVDVFPDKPADINFTGKMVWLDGEAEEFEWDGDLIYSDPA